MSLQDALKDIQALGAPRAKAPPKALPSPRPAAAPTRTRSLEQQAVLDSREPRLAVVALAGSGKTRTAIDYMAARSRQPWLYMVFNRAMKEEAVPLMPSHVRATTLHGWTFGRFGQPLGTKLNALSPGAHVAAVLRAAGANPAPALRDNHARLLWQTVLRFTQSADPLPGLVHVPAFAWLEVLRHPFNEASPADILQQVERLWEASINPAHPCPASHDHYLKLAQLSGVQWNRPVLLDEAQDASACMLALVSGQQQPMVMMGDPYQTLYSFRGARGNFADLASSLLPLTGSFRFAAAIATTADLSLRQLHCPWTMEGRGEMDSRVQQSEKPGAGDVILTHTNEHALAHGLALMAAGHAVSWLGPVQDTMDKLQALARWRNGETPLRPEWAAFASFADFEKWVLDVPGHPESTVFEWLERMDRQCPQWQQFQPLSADGVPAFRVGTIHQSKGMTFDRAFVDEGVLDALDGKDSERKEAWQRIYVALTRARHVLTLPESVMRALKKPVIQMPVLQGCFE